MAGKQINLRLRPVVLAYLDELDRIGGFGDGRTAIVRRFVENAIATLISEGMLEKKSALEFGEKIGDDKKPGDDDGEAKQK